MTNEHLTNHLTSGPGPFAPPKRSEVDALQAELADLRRQRAELLNRIDDLVSDPPITTAVYEHDLVTLLRKALRGHTTETLNIEVSSDEDGLLVNIPGLRIGDFGAIEPLVYTWDVDFTVEIRGTVTVTAPDEDEARELVDELIWDASTELTFDLDETRDGLVSCEWDHNHGTTGSVTER